MSVVVPLADAAAWSHRLEDSSRRAWASWRTWPAGGRRERTAPVQAMGPLATTWPATVGGLLLVGDAAGFYDPLTARACSAPCAAPSWRRTWRRPRFRPATARPNDLALSASSPPVFAAKARFTHALQFIVARRRLANLTARVLVRRPGLLDLLLGVVGDYVPPGGCFIRRAGVSPSRPRRAALL